MFSETRFPLASGGSVLVTDSEVRILAPDGAVLHFHALPAIARVDLAANVVSIALRSGASVQLTTASDADAAALHGRLMARMDQQQRALVPTPGSRQCVKTYDKEMHFMNDVGAMDADGWQVVGSAVFQPRSGWARILISFGWLALVYPPKPQIVVSYARTAAEPPPA